MKIFSVILFFGVAVTVLQARADDDNDGLFLNGTGVSALTLSQSGRFGPFGRLNSLRSLQFGNDPFSAQRFQQGALGFQGGLLGSQLGMQSPFLGLNGQTGFSNQLGFGGQFGLGSQFGLGNQLGLNSQLGLNGQFGLGGQLGLGNSQFGLGSQLGLGTSQFGLNSQLGLGNSQFGLGNSQFGLGNSQFGLGNSPFGLGNGQFGLGNSQFSLGSSQFGLNRPFGLNSQLGLQQGSLGLQGVQQLPNNQILLQGGQLASGLDSSSLLLNQNSQFGLGSSLNRPFLGSGINSPLGGSSLLGLQGSQFGNTVGLGSFDQSGFSQQPIGSFSSQSSKAFPFDNRVSGLNNLERTGQIPQNNIPLSPFASQFSNLVHQQSSMSPNGFNNNNQVPETGFTCNGRRPGYHADILSGCRIFHICTPDASGTMMKNSFNCPNMTLFNPVTSVCQAAETVSCREASGPFQQPLGSGLPIPQMMPTSSPTNFQIPAPFSSFQAGLPSTTTSRVPLELLRGSTFNNSPLNNE